MKQEQYVYAVWVEINHGPAFVMHAFSNSEDAYSWKDRMYAQWEDGMDSPVVMLNIKNVWVQGILVK
jgi:hypothetical protein